MVIIIINLFFHVVLVLQSYSYNNPESKVYSPVKNRTAMKNNNQYSDQYRGWGGNGAVCIWNVYLIVYLCVCVCVYLQPLVMRAINVSLVVIVQVFPFPFLYSPTPGVKMK